MKNSTAPKKRIIQLVFLVLTVSTFSLLSCSSDDDSTPVEEIDTRFKVVFDNDGSGAIIGDNTNKVLQQINFLNSISFVSSYFQIPNSSELQFVGRNSASDVNLYTIDLREFLGDTNSSLQASEVKLYTQDQGDGIFLSGFKEPNNPFVLTESSDADGILYREYSGNQLIESRDLSQEFNVGNVGNGGYAFFQDQGKIIILQEDFNASTESINVIDINNWSLTKYEGAFTSTLFGSFSYGNQGYLIGRGTSNGETVESIYTEDGTFVTEVDDFISRNVAIGFNTEKNQFEYLAREDVRRQTGKLNPTSGVLELTSITGETGFIWSPLFFFNDN